MIQLVLTFTALAPPMFEGLRHDFIAEALEEQHCSVSMSHMERVPVGPRPAAGSPFGTPTKLQSTLPFWIESTWLRFKYRRIESVSVRCDSEEQVAKTVALLKKLPTVPSLTIRSTPFELGDLEEVMMSCRVGKLGITSMPLPRTAISALSQPSLTWLCVMRTHFSSAGIDELPLSLEYFDATRTRINDDALPKFVKFTNLKRLKLRRTPTSRQAVETLRRQMPWCEIDWQPLQNP
ncbi:leucine-rich repeat domain-containing protein [Thalassoroseus pseudoceratinae]|uniref:hypothetical protein n=1 Tax=Thalassoroseus pseudoceratinae TaxID=2713176 RepID=UPI00141F435D|nr:hypothetical protein [Thalassoroseus pseudoceratinae]